MKANSGITVSVSGIITLAALPQQLPPWAVPNVEQTTAPATVGCRDGAGVGDLVGAVG